MESAPAQHSLERDPWPLPYQKGITMQGNLAAAAFGGALALCVSSIAMAQTAPCLNIKHSRAAFEYVFPGGIAVELTRRQQHDYALVFFKLQRQTAKPVSAVFVYSLPRALAFMILYDARGRCRRFVYPAAAHGAIMRVIAGVKT